MLAHFDCEERNLFCKSRVFDDVVFKRVFLFYEYIICFHYIFIALNFFRICFHYIFIALHYPISTLPEHLHSTFPSHAKLPENTLTKKKTFLFPL